MEENPLRPPLGDKNINTIAFQIFEDTEAIIGKPEPIPPNRKTYTYRCQLKNGAQVVVKYAPLKEVENQVAANHLNLNAPKVLGNSFVINEENEKGERSEKAWFAQDFIQNSKTLQALIAEEGYSDPVLKSLDESALLLAKIHGSLKEFASLSALPRFSQEEAYAKLEERMLRFEEAFERYDQETGGNSETERWKNTLAKINKTALTRFWTDGEVLVRWDYKPDNLLIQQNGGLRVFSIDWVGLHIGSPWIDLGFLLSDLPKDKRIRAARVYLNSRKIEMNEEEVLKNLRMAVAGAQLIHASSNASNLTNNIDLEYSMQRLSSHLNQLEKELTE